MCVHTRTQRRRPLRGVALSPERRCAGAVVTDRGTTAAASAVSSSRSSAPMSDSYLAAKAQFASDIFWRARKSAQSSRGESLLPQSLCLIFGASKIRQHPPPLDLLGDRWFVGDRWFGPDRDEWLYNILSAGHDDPPYVLIQPGPKQALPECAAGRVRVHLALVDDEWLGERVLTIDVWPDQMVGAALLPLAREAMEGWRGNMDRSYGGKFAPPGSWVGGHGCDCTRSIQTARSRAQLSHCTSTRRGVTMASLHFSSLLCVVGFALPTHFSRAWSTAGWRGPMRMPCSMTTSSAWFVRSGGPIGNMDAKIAGRPLHACGTHS